MRNSGAFDEKNCKQELSKACNDRHGVWACDVFRNMHVHHRWDVANQFKLCFRCLGDDHSGNQCIRSRVCDIQGCQKTHSKLGNRTIEKQTSNSTSNVRACNQQAVTSGDCQQLPSSATEGEHLERNFATQIIMMCSKLEVQGTMA